MSKRASAYKHGQPGREFEEERPEDPQDEPKRATAAQLAARKIKTLKGPRRPAGASSGLSAFNPNPPSASSFNFGPDPNAGAAPSNPFAQSAPPQQNASGGFTFGQPQQQSAPSGGMFAFGSNSTSSFPPTQSTPNPFANSTNSSFPPASGFGGNNNTNGTLSTFNTQPDLNFGNTASGFGASTPANGFTFGSQQSQQPAFGASQSKAASASSSNTFSFLGAAANKESSTPAPGGLLSNDNNASTSAQSGGLFSTSATPQNNPFGGFGQNSNNGSSSSAFNAFGNTSNNTTTSASPFQFGASTTAQESTSTPKGLFGGISAAAQASSSSETPKSLFSSISGVPQTNASSEAPKPLFGSITNASSQAPATPFGANTATTGGSSHFGASTPFTFGAQSNGVNTSTASTQGETTATPAFNFGNSAAKPATPTTSNNIFGNLGATTQQESTVPGQKSSDSTSTPAPTSFGGFGQISQSRSSNVTPAVGGLFSQMQTQTPTVPAKKSSFAGFGSNKSDTESASTEPSKNEPAASEAAAQNPFEQTQFGKQNRRGGSPEAPATTEPTQTEKPVQNPFASMSAFTPASAQKPEQQPATHTPSTSMFQASKPITPASASASTEPTFLPTTTLAATTSSAKETPKDAPAPPIPRATVPPNWAADTTDSNDIRENIKKLADLNEAFRTKIAQLPATADWSALSKFHSQKSSELKKKIDDLRKEAAVAKGITGDETVLSTKRKNDESARLESPVKKARSGEPPTTPNSKATALPSTTPKTNPPLKAFNLFASASTQPTTPATEKPASTATGEKKDIESADVGGFKPNFGTSTPSAFTGFKPNFGASSTSKSGSGGFFGQFGGKTKEQLREERMKKALEEGYESPTTSEEEEGNYETKEQFLARWNKEEDERQAALDAAANSTTLKFAPTATTKKTDTPGFKFTAASSNAPSTQSLASGASTPGFLSSRIGSPAPSAEGPRSVFDTPLGAQTPTNNLFGHLSAASSQHQDDSDDEADDESAPKPSVEDESKKRKPGGTGDTESESSETLEESMKRKKPATKGSSLLDRMTGANSDADQEASEVTKKPSLADRMTRDNSEAAPDANGQEVRQPILNATNSKLFNFGGSQTPITKKPFHFDFDGAAAKSAPPKQNAFALKTDTFAGDQTFKIGSPIKFGPSANANTPFTITPATPTAATPAESSATPAQSASNPFAFLSTATSAATSAVSSRAVTPATDAEASGTDSAAINEEEGQNFVDTDDKSLLSEAERDEFDVLFEHDKVIASKIVKKEGEAPKWQKIANGRLWALRNKNDNSVIIRLRMKSGAVKINHRIVPTIKSTLTGNTKSQVHTTAPLVKDDGSTGFEGLVFAFQAGSVADKQELASKFSSIYNENV